MEKSVKFCPFYEERALLRYRAIYELPNSKLKLSLFTICLFYTSSEQWKMAKVAWTKQQALILYNFFKASKSVAKCKTNWNIDEFASPNEMRRRKYVWQWLHPIYHSIFKHVKIYLKVHVCPILILVDIRVIQFF